MAACMNLEKMLMQETTPKDAYNKILLIPGYAECLKH